MLRPTIYIGATSKLAELLKLLADVCETRGDAADAAAPLTPVANAPARTSRSSGSVARQSHG